MRFANFYSQVINSISGMAAPITTLLQKGTHVSWTLETQVAVECLKQKVITAPILIHCNLGWPFTVKVDASNFALGAVLSHMAVSNGQLHPSTFLLMQAHPSKTKLCHSQSYWPSQQPLRNGGISWRVQLPNPSPHRLQKPGIPKDSSAPQETCYPPYIPCCPMIPFQFRSPEP